MIERANPISIADLKVLQQDVNSKGSLNLARAIATRSPEAAGNTEALLAGLGRWDEDYYVESKGAAALELIAYHLAQNYYEQRYGKANCEYLLRSPAVCTFLLQDIGSKALDSIIPGALGNAAADLQISRPGVTCLC